MIGKTFGHLTVVDKFPTPSGRETWLCKCKCGNHKGGSTKQLMDSLVMSCGCEPGNEGPIGAMGRSHNMSETPIYKSWTMMKHRCSNPNYNLYEYYGGRGIKVCDRWMVFENFYADMAPRPLDGTLDRIKTDGDYEPGNCRWATRLEQLMNRSNTLTFVFQGERHTLLDWAIIVGEKRTKLYLRMYRTQCWDIGAVFEWLGIKDKVKALIECTDELPDMRMAA